jgi:hypothetical protein
MPGITVAIEERLTAAAGPRGTSYKMDLVLRANGGYCRYIDVAIADAGVRKYNNAGEWETEMKAAAIREAEKRNKFASLAPHTFVPFVIESSGRPGKAAREFFNEPQIPGKVVHRLLERISVLIAIRGGKHIEHRFPSPSGRSCRWLRGALQYLCMCSALSYHVAIFQAYF